MFARVAAATLIAGALLGSAAASAEATDIYVSPKGADAGPGTKAKPLRTLAAARDAAAAVSRPLQDDIVIRIAGGTYRQRGPLQLGAADSGGNGHEVVYRAQGGQDVLISGGRRISDWELYDSDAGIYRARAPKGLATRQLYVDGRRAVRAQSELDPAGFTKTADGYRSTELDLSQAENPGDMEVLSNWRWKSFRCPVASISGEQITMQQPCWHNANVFIGPAGMGLPTRIVNALELLDEPGEWYLDRSSGWIYYAPMAGEDLEQADVEAAGTQILIDGRGTLESPVHDLRFKGLDFAYATWMGVSGPEGYADDQTGFRVTGPNQPQTFEHAEDTTRTPGNLRFGYAHDITFRDNSFEHMGAVALDFDTGSRDNVISGNRFDDISAAAIQVGGVDIVDHHPTEPGQITRGNRISDNRITRAAQEFYDAAGIFVGYTTRTSINHNTLSDLPYSGIAIGWGWGMTDPGQFPGCTGCPFQHWRVYDTPTTSRNNRIVGNKISNYLQVLYDGGGIYSLGQQGTSLESGEVIARNVVFGKAPAHGGNAIYTDGGSRYITSRNNAMWKNPTGLDGPDGSPYGHDWGGCRPFGDIVWEQNWWSNPAEKYDCYPPYPPQNVVLTDNELISGRPDVPKHVIADAGARR